MALVSRKKQKIKTSRNRDYDEFEIPWTHADIKLILFNIRNVLAKESYFLFKNRIFFFQFMKNHLFGQECKDQKKWIAPETKLVNMGRWLDSNAGLSTEIQNQFSLNKPMALGYCAKLTYGSKVNSNTNRIKIFPRISRAIFSAKKCSPHYSLLVGSRHNGELNRCEMLIRNSYTTNWWAHEQAECFCEEKIDSNGKKLKRNCRFNEFTKMENGRPSHPNLKVLGCWFDGNRLLSNTYDLSYLE